MNRSRSTTRRSTPVRTLAATAAALGAGLLAATHVAASYGSTDGTLTLTAYHGPAGAPISATYVWQGPGACNAGQKAAFYWDYQFQHSYTWYRGMAPFLLHSGVCAATLTFAPGYGDDDPGAHDVTVWDTQFGPATDTWIYYQTDQPPLPPTPAPTATPTATPTPHPTATPTPAPPVPGGGQSNAGSGDGGGTAIAGGGTAATATTGASGSGHSATLAATTAAGAQPGISVWVFILGALAVIAAGAGVLVGRRIAR
ncbi:MAG: hypothetical protein JOZ75_04905 [Candidatus Dormibacteraeota bacterium]|nr:hypothetical protein [Candidatus Dormibacteraeota bacterium]